MSLPCCIGVDFNVVISEDEKWGGFVNISACSVFKNVICESNLVDLPLDGTKFTLSNGHNELSINRLDKFLVSLDWSNLFPDVRQLCLPKGLSNHNLVVLGEKSTDHGPTLFRWLDFGWIIKGWLEFW